MGVAGRFGTQTGRVPAGPTTLARRTSLVGRTAAGIGIAAALAACSSSPAPAASPSASASPTASSSPTATVPVWPLTGLPAAAGVALRPALAFKVDNVWGALPQQGVNSADLVFEEPVEGGLTRLVAVFDSENPGRVAPIRSARPVDAQILRLFGPSILMFSGASSHEIGPVKALSNSLLLSMDSGAPLFARDPNRPGVHDVYASTSEAWKYALAHGASPVPPRAPWLFAPAVSPLALPIKVADMQFGDAHAVWTYDATTTRYNRAQNGSPDRDTKGVALWADTVLVLNVPTYLVPGLRDVLGNPTPDARITGTGTVWLLRDGTMVKGTWSRASLAAPLTFTGADGSALGVKPGRTWVELLPRGLTPAFR